MARLKACWFDYLWRGDDCFPGVEYQLTDGTDGEILCATEPVARQLVKDLQEGRVNIKEYTG